MLHKGERDAGTIIALLTEKGMNGRLFERIPNASGDRIWTCTRIQKSENPSEFNQYLRDRHSSDPDLWIVELDIADGERFIGQTGLTG